MANAAMNAEVLATAFSAFNQQSSQLEAAYRQLEDKVSDLSRQLAASRNARHAELLEKERLGNRMVHLLEALPGAIIVINGSGIITQCNNKSSELLDSPLLGCAWSEIVRREFCPGASADGELELRDGRRLSLARRALESEPGEILLLTDVSESRRMSDMLQRHQRLSSIGEMTARLGHQIRTPLASALLYASQLVNLGTLKQKKVAGKIVSRLEELGGMMDDMLRYAGGAKKSDEVVNVAGLLRDVAESIAPRLVKSARLHIEIADTNLVVEANCAALKGALLNLVDNALQASEARPEVELGAVRSRGQICLTVSDNGGGIRDDIRSRLFEPFFTTRPQGTGLGLAVVRSVAEAHDGEVLVESSQHGTTFAICLPAPAETSPEESRTEACSMGEYRD